MGLQRKVAPFCGERMFSAKDLGQHNVTVRNKYFGQHICSADSAPITSRSDKDLQVETPFSIKLHIIM